MTRQEVEHFLSGYRMAKKRIRSLTEQIAELRESKMSVGSPELDAMPKGSDISDLSVYAARLDELERELMSEQAAAEKALEEVIRAINLIESETEREAMTLYYIRGYRWKKVCADLNYSRKQIFRFRNRAIHSLSLILKDDIE